MRQICFIRFNMVKHKFNRYPVNQTVYIFYMQSCKCSHHMSMQCVALLFVSQHKYSTYTVQFHSIVITYYEIIIVSGYTMQERINGKLLKGFESVFFYSSAIVLHPDISKNRPKLVLFQLYHGELGCNIQLKQLFSLCYVYTLLS